MKKVQLCPNDISTVLSNNISDNKSVFVFPTDVVMNSWIDWIITHPSLSGTDAVAFEQFTAWDNFKRDFVSAQQEGQSVIPTVLRKMFITDLIAQNAAKPRNERLQVIINPDDSFASEADSFSDWLSKNLQSLHFWKKRLEQNRDEYGELDSEDKDYLYIYEKYSDFLNQNNLFEAAWVEDIEFSEKEKHFHIFYPEMLEDFLDYQDIFAKADNISVYTLPENIESPSAYFYPDSRKELRQTMLQIIDVVKSGKADWSEISLSIPNLDTYRPYIEREFDLYEIPYVIKAGVSLTKNSAGRIFREIYDCYNNKFSFDSVRTLLLDECVPWREEFNNIREDLIREGNRMRCICSVNKDIWLSAFQSKLNNLDYLLKSDFTDTEKKEEIAGQIIYFEDLKKFYMKVRNSVSSFFPKEKEKNTFENIRTSWMNFKSSFLKKDKDFSEDANNILSRCIKELSEIIEIEKKYKDCNLNIPSPYNFFLQELDKKTYTKQAKTTGVNIYPYKLSAAGYFKYQFIIDCSQKNLDISYKRLTYLNNTKRAKLKLTNDDKMINASEVFIKLYGKETECTDKSFVHFSAAENTFNGFSIPHSQLKIVTDENGNNVIPDRDKEDYILNEKKLIRDPLAISLPLEITETQKASYENWKSCSLQQESKEKINEQLKNDIKYVLIDNRNDEKSENKKIKITARGDLEQFFPCPRKWLFKSVLKLHEDTLDINLMQNYDMGNLNHKIMESFMNIFRNKILPFYDENECVFKIKNFTDKDIEVKAENYNDEIINILYGEKNIVTDAIKAPSDFRDSPLVIETLLSQKEKIADNIMAFLKKLLLPYGYFDSGKKPRKINGIGNCIVLGIEEKLDASMPDYDYFGIIDCYVLSPENEIIIIDYKNSSSAIPDAKNIRIDENNILRDFQMPLYYQLIGNNRQEEIGAGYFYAIKDGKDRVVTDKILNEYNMEKDNISWDPDLYSTIITLNEYSDLFIKKISGNNFTPTQSNSKKDKMNVKSYEACSKCPFKSICRTTYTIAGKLISSKKGVKNE